MEILKNNLLCTYVNWAGRHLGANDVGEVIKANKTMAFEGPCGVGRLRIISKLLDNLVM